MGIGLLPRFTPPVQKRVQAWSRNAGWQGFRHSESRDIELRDETGRLAMTYTVVIETTRTGFGVHVPDLPGCVATGPDREVAIERITEAIGIHIRGMREDGLVVPVPTSTAETITIDI